MYSSMAFEHLIIESAVSAFGDFFESHAETDVEETITFTHDQLSERDRRMFTWGGRYGASFVILAAFAGALYGWTRARENR